MIDRLHRALERIDELPPELQEQLAEIIEQHTEAVDMPLESLGGAWGDLPDTFDEIARYARRDSPRQPSDAAY